jgi:hypothetical protein
MVGLRRCPVSSLERADRSIPLRKEFVGSLGAAIVAAIGAEAVAASLIAAGQLDRMGDVEIARSLPPRIPRGPDIEAF